MRRRRRAWVWAWLALSAVACGGASPEHAARARRAGTANGGAPRWVHESNDSLAARMRGIARRMQQAHLTIGPLEGRGFLAGGEADTLPLDLPPDTCASVVALASPGIQDLDATLYAPEGEMLAEDVEPDAHPTVQVCAGPDGRHLYYMLRAYDGAGAYLFAAFVGPRRSFETAARILGGRPGVAGDTATDVEFDTRVRDFGLGVERRGFRSMGDPRHVQLAQAQRVRVGLQVSAGSCYTVAAFATPPGLGDVDVRVIDALGVEVARDVSPTPDASTQFCSNRDDEFAIEVAAARGQGETTVTMYKGAVAVVGGASGLWLGSRSDALLSALPIEEALGRDLASARELGYETPRTVARGILVQGEAVSHEVGLARGRCSIVVASGGRGVGKLAVRVVDQDGHVLAVGETRPARPTAAANVAVCAHAQARAHVEVIARVGGGAYAVTTLSRARPTDLTTADRDDEASALVDALDRARSDGWAARDAAHAIERVPLTGAAPVERRLRLSAGRCVRASLVAAAAGGSRAPSAAGFGVEGALARGGHVITRDAGRAAEVSACVTADTDVVLTIRAQGGAQSAWLAVFEKR